MNGESLLIFLLVGVLAGWLGGIVVKGYGLGLVGDMIVGVIGSFIGGWVFNNFHIVHGTGFVGELIGATVGAILLLFVLRLVRRRRAF
ncbi:MAG TPA: GlsB/YeaQ/YmgE family stress response membrane protein [Caulobacteraceae bacterium]|nr:GlsB/YeaQ/YmgE family stress response membrane protein [Caulobacteraceae bacterium]